jgi:hypothetical protein
MSFVETVCRTSIRLPLSHEQAKGKRHVSTICPHTGQPPRDFGSGGICPARKGCAYEKEGTLIEVFSIAICHIIALPNLLEAEPSKIIGSDVNSSGRGLKIKTVERR